MNATGHIMKAPSTGRVIGVAAGVCVSLWALFWLLSVPAGTFDVGDRLGFMCAVACADAALGFLWALGFAYIVRTQNWSYRACRLAGICLLVPGSLLFLNHGRALLIANFLLLQISVTSYLCRRIAFPEMSDEEAAAPEPPPTMFPKEALPRFVRPASLGHFWSGKTKAKKFRGFRSGFFLVTISLRGDQERRNMRQKVSQAGRPN